jgi:hypothetical protein
MRVGAAIEAAAIHSAAIHCIIPAAMHTGAPIHASAAMHAAPTVTHPAASGAHLNDETIIQLRRGSPCAIGFYGFRLRRREAQQRRKRDPSADRSAAFHSRSSLCGALKGRLLW